jgi:hypothetical protein
MIGKIKDETGSFPLAPRPIAVASVVGAVAMLVVGWRQPRTAEVRV